MKIHVISICCGTKLRLQYPEFCELVCNQDIIDFIKETKTDDLDTIELPGYIFKMQIKNKIAENLVE